MSSSEIRRKIKDAGLFQYQVADKVGVNEVTFIRWLRKPLSPEREQIVSDAIKALKGSTRSSDHV